MKKILFVAVSALFSLTANAQESNFAQKGDLGVELQFNPFSNNYNTFKVDGLSVRYWLTDKDVIRGTLSFGISNQTNRANMVAPIQDDYTATVYGTEAAAATAFKLANETYDHQLDDYSKESSSSFGLNLGYERHLFQKGRVDLYAGAELGFKKAWASSYAESVMGTLNTTGDAFSAWHTNTTEYSGRNLVGDFASFTFNFGLFTGIDFYVYKQLYLGAELGIALETTSRNNYTKETDTWDPISAKMVNRVEEYDVKGNTLDLAIKAAPALRIGWTF